MYSLRPLAEADLKQVLGWRNSDRIRAISFRDHLISQEEHIAWFRKLEISSDKKSFIFEVEGRAVGTVNFFDIDLTHQRCSWGFYLGEPDLKKGTGYEMGRLALHHAFSNFNVQKICAESFDFNEASIAYHLKLGFLREGLLKKHQMKDGELRDVVLFALFRDDWNRRN